MRKGPIIPVSELEKRIDEYFANVTPKQLKKDLEKAGYSVYSKVPDFLTLEEDQK